MKFPAAGCCLVLSLLHIGVIEDSCNCVRGFYDFSLFYLIALFPLYALALYLLAKVRQAFRAVAFLLLATSVWEVVTSGRYLYQLHYQDLTMCEFIQNQIPYCEYAYAVSFAHLSAVLVMSLLTIVLLLKFKLLAKKRAAAN